MEKNNLLLHEPNDIKNYTNISLISKYNRKKIWKHNKVLANIKKMNIGHGDSQYSKPQFFHFMM